MKLNQAKVKVITDADPAVFEGLVNDFLEAQKEETLVSMQFAESAGTYTAFIVYTK